MKNVFEAYRKYYENKPNDVKVTAVIVDQPVLFPEYEKEIEEIKNEPVQPEEIKPVDLPVKIDKAPAHISLLHQIMSEETRVREFREMLRCKYYHLEDRKAPQKEFAQNHAAITQCTRELQDLYIKRKHIEIHGSMPDPMKLISDEEQNLIRSLKYDRKRIVDKCGKLNRKIDTYLSTAKGAELRPKWENELEECQLQLLEIDQKIDAINGLA
jgi:hypothetical protein